MKIAMKMPPLEKIHEALSAVADNRVEMGEGEAFVISSGGGKRYTVRWEGKVFSANDNATYWQLYPGYPIIAVLLLSGRLPLEDDIAGCFSGIDWSDLNRNTSADTTGRLPRYWRACVTRTLIRR